MVVLSKMPSSELKKALLIKYQGFESKYEELLTELQTVSLIITREIRNIDLLFPEYTPHDLDYHISHLFQISDKLLGTERYMEMNFMELYLLVIAIYAHDWGMAVSVDERDCIINDVENLTFNLLEGEKEHFAEYLNSKIGAGYSKDDLDISIWQEYVRNTHALRSGKRIQSHYKKVNGSVADASQKLCVGHWLNIDNINEKNGYYTDDSVSGEVVNLKALTIYIRLIDLFDLAEDRTPYVIWKYINPKNPYSKMEWEKHRALHQVSCPTYESGRVILVRGSTDDHEVYSSIMDLKDLCNRYFRECLDTLAHMKDTRHELGVYFIDWRIEPINFTPVSIRFDFNRESIFDVLSQEIYDFHPYVYIRELLQNSVDAITFRREVLNRCGIGGDSIGRIFVEVSDVVDDEFTITVLDDGIGMDEYILKHYFSVLGRSYYRSNDFKIRHLEMSPISRFGVGVLSCFGIAESMEIITAREPYLGNDSHGLRVCIYDIQRQFRIEKIPTYKKTIGTQIKLRVKTSCLEKQLKHKDIDISEYDITEYIKSIAGFLPYPIIVNERGKRAIIVNPDMEMENQKRFINNYEEYDIYKINRVYEVEDMVCFQDVNNFRKIFESRSIDVSKDLNMKEIEGILNFAVLKSSDTVIVNATASWPTDEIKVITHEKENYRIRWYESRKVGPNDRKKANNDYLKIYSNGFWLEKESKHYYDLRSHLFPKPIIRINYLESYDEISVSRFESIGHDNFNMAYDKHGNKKKTIIDKIWCELTLFLKKELCEKQSYMKELDFLRQFTLYVQTYQLKYSDFELDFLESIELPMLNEQGEIFYCSLNDKQTLRLFPRKERKQLIDYFKWGSVGQSMIDGNYGECILFLDSNSFLRSTLQSTSNSICEIVSGNFHIQKIEITKSLSNKLPIFQEIWSKGHEKRKTEHILKLLNRMNYLDEIILEEVVASYKNELKLDKIVEFDINSSDKFAYRNEYFNIQHPLTIALIQYCFLIKQLQKREKDNIKFAEVSDLFFDLIFFESVSGTESKVYKLDDINSQLKSIRERLQYFYEELKLEKCELSLNDFVECTIEIVEDGFSIVKDEYKFYVFDELF